MNDLDQKLKENQSSNVTVLNIIIKLEIYCNNQELLGFTSGVFAFLISPSALNRFI